MSPRWGLGFGDAIFYKHVAPLGLCGFIGALSRDMNLDLRGFMILGNGLKSTAETRRAQSFFYFFSVSLITSARRLG